MLLPRALALRVLLTALLLLGRVVAKLRSGDPIPGEWVVMFASNDAQEEYKKVVRRGSVATAAVVDTVAIGDQTGEVARLSRSQLRRVRRIKGVSVQPNRYIALDDPYLGKGAAAISALGAQAGTATWGIDRIDHKKLPLDGKYTYDTAGAGSGVVVYVVDTGIRTTHSEFATGRATWGTNTVSTATTDDNGHGTHCAGTVGGATYGVAKKASLVAVKVLGADGGGTSVTVTNGINWVVKQCKGTTKKCIMSMSLGCQGSDSTIESAVKAAITAGIVVVVAACNGKADACGFTPAKVPDALTVAATTNTDSRDTTYSNYGSCVDLFAPGTSITSAWYTSNTAAAVASGTSMATPHVAGAAAVLWSLNPTWTAATLRSKILSLASTKVVSNLGTGSPNRLVYTNTGL